MEVTFKIETVAGQVWRLALPQIINFNNIYVHVRLFHLMASAN